MKKTWLIILVINICIALVVFWLYSQLKKEKQGQEAQVVQAPQAIQEKQSLEYPYFPEGEMFLDDEKTWKIKYFQPIFKEMIEEDQTRYLVVNYSSGVDGTMEEGKIFVGTQIPYFNSENQKTVIDSLKLKEELKPGDRFRVNYLAEAPEDFSLQQPDCQNNELKCLLAFLKQESDAKGEKKFYPFGVYRNLKQ